MRKVVEVLDRLEAEGYYERWSLAGATALMYYVPPVMTDDVDIAIALPTSGILVSLAPLYERLRKLGYNEVIGEHIRIEGANVQFIMAAPGSVQESALRSKARKVKLAGVSVRIFPLEHLLAIMVGLGRPKDRVRLAMVLSEHGDKVPWRKFNALVKKHGLEARLSRFKAEAGLE